MATKDDQKKQIQVRVDPDLAAAVDAAVKARGIVKNDFMVSAVKRELDADKAVSVPVNGHNEHAELMLDMITEMFKYLLPLRDDMDPQDAERIKALFAKCRAAIAPPSAPSIQDHP